MYKNQLQELAQRSCFNLPSYSCIREGPDHAPRFKATVNFNGESFESPTFCSTLRQAEHAAAEVALNTLASGGPSRALAARVLDETGVYKNLLQETAHRAGLKLPVYTTIRSGPGHVPIFLCTVELAGMSFNGEPARTKKQAQKNAAMAAWSALKRMVQHDPSSSSLSSSSVETKKGNEEQEQAIVACLLASLQPAESKNFKPKNLQCSQDRVIPVCRELTLPTPSLYTMRCQGWEDQNFSPEVAIYQMWQQEQLLLLQNHVLALPVPLAPPPVPQILPYVHSILPCDSHPFFPVRGPEPTPAAARIETATSAPPLNLTDHLVSNPSEGKSMVTIQEIHEENTEKSSECSPSTAPDTPILGGLNVEQRFKESVHEKDKHKGVGLENKIESLQPGESQAEQYDWASHGSLHAGYKPVDFQVQNPCGFGFPPSAQQYPSRSSLPRSYSPPVMIRTVRPVYSSKTSPSIHNMMPVSSFPRPQDLAARIAAPPRMRTGLPLYSAGPQPHRMDIGGLHPRFVAPAVRIRSVVPVCSAPPPREMPSSGQEGVLANQNTEDTMPEDMSKASSELGKLGI